MSPFDMKQFLFLCLWLVFHVLCLIFKIINTEGGTVKTTPNRRKHTSYLKNRLFLTFWTVYFFFLISFLFCHKICDLVEFYGV